MDQWDCEHRTRTESDEEIEEGGIYFFEKIEEKSRSRNQCKNQKREKHREKY